MPLSAAYPLLISAIETAFKEKQQSYEKSDASKKMTDAEREAIDLKFYIALAAAIHSYTSSAVVSTMVVGAMVGTAAPIILGVPAAPAFGPVTGVGWGNLV
tara:strand:- start:39 stop:341 length:303 start_codon:yes stop_codon:yes gene_type:complete